MDEGTTVVDLFTAPNLAQFDEIEAELAGADGVLAVVSPRTALQFTQNLVTVAPDGTPTEDATQSVAGTALLGAREREPDPAAQELRLADSLITLERLSAVPPPERTFDNRAWVEFLLFDNRGEIRKALRAFFPDESHAQFVTRLTGNADIEEEGVASEAVQAAFEGREFDNATTLTTGAPVLLKGINDYLRGGFLFLGGIAVALMVLILLLTFRVRWRLLPLGVIVVGVVWAFGLAGYLGIPLSVVTIAGLPVLLGVGIDFAIQMHSRLGSLPRKAGPLLLVGSVVVFVGGAVVDDGLSLQTDPEEWVDQDSAVIADQSALNLTFRTGPSSLEERAVVVNDVRASVDPPAGISATPSGLAVVGVGLLENLEANRTLLTYVSLGLVLGFLLLRLRNVVQAVLALVPVLTGVGASALIAGAAGFKLSPLTALGGPLVIAACTEFTSLILARYLEERRRGLAPQEAADVAAARTGRAFVASALATIAGVGVLAASSLPLLRDFGIIVSINVAVALLSALVVLPPLVVWADDRGWLLGRKATAATPTGGRPRARPQQAPAPRA